jgi:hypothetical protein
MEGPMPSFPSKGSVLSATDSSTSRIEIGLTLSGDKGQLPEHSRFWALSPALPQVLDSSFYVGFDNFPHTAEFLTHIDFLLQETALSTLTFFCGTNKILFLKIKPHNFPQNL